MEVTNTNLLSRKRLCRSFVLTGVEVIAADVSRFKNYKKKTIFTIMPFSTS